MAMHSPPHPGGLLAEELAELRISISRAARDLGVSRQTLSGIVNGSKPITAEMAARIGTYLGSGAELWLRMQAQHDLWEAENRMRAELARIPAAKDVTAA